MELTLYKISEEQRRIEAMLDESCGEITPEIEELLAVNEGNFMEKSRDYGHAILHYKAIVAAIKAEKDRLDAIKKTAENAIKRMDERLVAAMKQFGKPKIELDTMKLSLRKSERVIVDDENAVPADCKTIKVEISLTSLKAHIKAAFDRVLAA